MNIYKFSNREKREMKKLTSVLWLHQPSINGETHKRVKESILLLMAKSGKKRRTNLELTKLRKGLFREKAYIGELNRNKGKRPFQIEKRFFLPSSLNSPFFEEQIKRIHLGYGRKKRKKRHLSLLQKLPLSPLRGGEVRDRKSAYKGKLLNNRKIWYFQKAIAIPGRNRNLSGHFSRKNKFYKKI